MKTCSYWTNGQRHGLEILAGIGKMPVVAGRHVRRLEFEIDTEHWNGKPEGGKRWAEPIFR
jgi:hypothetical protein